MDTRPVFASLLAGCLLVLFCGCHKWEAEREAILMHAPASAETVVRLHWVGKKQMGIEASAYYLTRLWHLPESRRLEAQTLDKLSAAPWLLTGGPPAVENAPIDLMRPLLDDLLREESYFEIRQPTNSARQAVFAIRLDDTRAGMWRTNLVGVIATITGIQTMDILDKGEGWALRQQAPAREFRLTRTNGWTVLGIGAEGNALLQQTLARIQFVEPESTSNDLSWLEAEVDTARFGSHRAATLFPPVANSRIALTLKGDGGRVLTRVQLAFPEPPVLSLEPWSVPTNLMRGSLSSFTAIRGAAPWISGLKAWDRLQISTPPAQMFSWSHPGSAFQTYVAVPLPSAKQSVNGWVTRLLENGNPWLRDRGYVGFERLPGSDGVIWGNLPDVKPFLAASESGEFAYAGLLPVHGGEAPQLPERWLERYSNATNLVAYEWEDTGARAQADSAIAQLLRLVLRRAPLPPDSASVAWLGALMPRLDISETVVTRTASNQFSVERDSTIGFTGAELNLIADWLESPHFPLGLHSTRVRPVPAAESTN